MLIENPARRNNGQESADNVDDLEVLTVAEVASLLRIGRNLAYEMIAEGRLPHVRIGHRIVVPRQQLMNWLEAECRSSDDPMIEVDSAQPKALEH